MASTIETTPRGHLTAQLTRFVETLRETGLAVGPAQSVEALQALSHIDVSRRADFRAALRAVLITRADQAALFDEAFALFWRNPDLLGRLQGSLEYAQSEGGHSQEGRRASRRVSEALGNRKRETQRMTAEVEADRLASDREKLMRMDFAQMSAAEIAAAEAEMQRLTLPLERLRTRRRRAASAGDRIDMPATLRRTLRQGGETITLARKKQRRKPSPLVILCDISGSMGLYSRMLLHFLHALTNDHDRVDVFLFGTRLTRVTRALRHRDIDAALASVGGTAPDWGGGTLIGTCLRQFNRDWGRRVLGQGASTLMITDGLDRSEGVDLGFEAARLSRSSRRLIWLNPLLRYDRFAPKPAGIRAMLPYVDDFRPAHNLASMAALIESLSAPPQPRATAMRRWDRALAEVERAAASQELQQ